MATSRKCDFTVHGAMATSPEMKEKHKHRGSETEEGASGERQVGAEDGGRKDKQRGRWRQRQGRTQRTFSVQFTHTDC